MDAFKQVVTFMEKILAGVMDLAAEYWIVGIVITLPVAFMLIAGLVHVFTLPFRGTAMAYRDKWYGVFIKNIKAQREAEERERIRREKNFARAEKSQKQQEAQQARQRVKQEAEDSRQRAANAMFADHADAVFVDVDGKRYWRDGIKRHKIALGTDASKKVQKTKSTKRVTPDLTNADAFVDVDE